MRRRKATAVAMGLFAALLIAGGEAIAQGTVRDSRTGLTWEQADNKEWLNWEDACDYCDTLALGGYSDWRLPSVDELRTIVDHTELNMAMSSVYQGYSASRSQIYWTATEYAGHSATPAHYAWGISFYSGSVHPRYKPYYHSIRCVRGPAYVPFEPSDEGPGIVRNTVSGLLWQNDQVVVRSFDEAQTYCQELTLGGQEWRLPNISELQEIVDYSALRPAVNSAFIGTTQNTLFWSKTDYAGSVGQKNWTVNFENGSVFGDSDLNGKTFSNCVRCVSGTESSAVSSTCDPGDEASLIVTVLDALNGTAVTGLPVTVEGATTSTTGGGEARFDNLAEPAVTVLIDEKGFVPVEKAVSLVCGEINRITVAALREDTGTARGDIRIIMTWGEDPADLDSHLTGPEEGGGTFEVYYANQSSTDTRVNLDIDDTTSYGPETITIQKLNNTFTAGSYSYYVRHFSGDSSINAERQHISVTVYQGATLIGVYQPPRAEEQDVGRRWDVISFTISSDGRVSFVVGSTGTEPYIFVAPYNADFGTVVLENAQAAPIILNVSNLGTLELNITDISYDQNNYLVQSGTCGSLTPRVGLGSTCTISLEMKPKRFGEFNDTLRILSNDGHVPNLVIPITATVVSNLAMEPAYQKLPVGATVTFEVSGGVPPYTVKSTSPNAVATIDGQTVSVTGNGVGVFRITVTDSNESTFESRAEVIDPADIGLWAYFHAVPTISQGAPQTVQFTSGSVSPDGIIDSWQWDFGDQSTGTGANPTHSYSTSGSYTVALTVARGGDTDTITRTNYVNVYGYGDLNCDGDVDIADAILAMDEQLSDEVLSTLCFSDLDGDGKIGLGEVLYIIQAVAGLR